jgi:hypothetical protein
MFASDLKVSTGNSSWQYWIDDVDNLPDLSISETKLAKDSIIVIMKEVFKARLNDYPPGPAEHPIGFCLHTNTFRTRSWLIWLAQSIQNALKQTNGRQLVDKLKNRKKFREVLLDLTVANVFINMGLEVELYQYIVETGRRPDLKVMDRKRKEQFYVEMTEIQYSNRAEQFRAVFSKISDLLSAEIMKNPRVYPIARILWHPSRDSIPFPDTLLEKIREAIDRARGSGFEILEEKGIIDLAVATQDNLSIINKWIEEKGLTSDEKMILSDNSILFGRTPHADLNYRLKAKLKSEKKQLPMELPNVIVIRDYLFFNAYRNSIREEIKIISKYLTYRNVAMFILIDGYGFNGFNKEVREGKHVYSLRYEKEHANEVLLITNTSSKANQFTRELRRKIIKGFVCGKPLLL